MRARVVIRFHDPGDPFLGRAVFLGLANDLAARFSSLEFLVSVPLNGLVLTDEVRDSVRMIWHWLLLQLFRPNGRAGEVFQAAHRPGASQHSCGAAP